MTLSLSTLKRLCEQAQTGLVYENDGTVGGILVRYPTGRPVRHDSPLDAEMHAAAVNVAPDLLARLESAEAELARIRPVYEAAVEWFQCDESSEEHDSIETRLLDAIDTARKDQK